MSDDTQTTSAGSKDQALENMRHLGKGRYIAWTQAGFKKAIRDHLKGTESDGQPVHGFPTKYPSVVHFVAGYQGYHFWSARCQTMSGAIEDARKYLQALEIADAEHQAAVVGKP